MALHTRFILGFFSLVLFLGGAQLWFSYQDNRVAQHFDALETANFSETYHASRVNMLVQRVKSNLRELMLERTLGFHADEVVYVENTLANSLDELAKAGMDWLQAVEQDIAQLDAGTNIAREQEELDELVAVLALLGKFVTQSRTFLAEFQSGDAAVKSLHDYFESSLEPNSRVLQRRLEALWQQTLVEARDENRRFALEHDRSHFYHFGMIAVAGLLAVVLGVFYSRWVTRSLRRLTWAVKEIEKGHYRTRLPKGKGDEVAQLAASITHLSSSLQQTMSEQARVEGELRDVNDELDTIIEHLPDMLFIKDAETLNFVRINSAGEKFLGLSRKDVLGKCDHDFFPAEQADIFMAGDRQALASDTVLVIEEESINTSQGVRYLHTRKLAIRNSRGEAKLLLGISRDVTAEKTLRDELSHLASHDPLTGLHNRRATEQRLESEFERAQRYQTPLAVIMLDVDHFKAINDEYGHKSGDDVLCVLAGKMSSALRNTDLVGRFGGEEFVIVMPMTDSQQALEFAERLRSEIAVLQSQVSTGDTVTFTVSMGVSCFHDGCASWEAMVSAADSALYQAKRSGRNRVVLAA